MFVVNIFLCSFVIQSLFRSFEKIFAILRAGRAGEATVHYIDEDTALLAQSLFDGEEFFGHRMTVRSSLSRMMIVLQ